MLQPLKPAAWGNKKKRKSRNERNTKRNTVYMAHIEHYALSSALPLPTTTQSFPSLLNPRVVCCMLAGATQLAMTRRVMWQQRTLRSAL